MSCAQTTVNINFEGPHVAFLFRKLESISILILEATLLICSEIESFGHRTLTLQDVVKMKYFRACQQESFRLLPTTNGNLRIIPNDIVLRGYKIPAGTLIIWNTMLLSQDDSIFENPGNSQLNAKYWIL